MKNHPLVFGHRGASDEAPENTLKAFQLAMDQGADGIETDLRFSNDGVMVCFHDDTLLRLVGNPAKISEMVYEELSSLVRNSPFFQGEVIPKLQNLLGWRPKGCLLMLELKDERFRQVFWVEQLLSILQQFEASSGLWISSFDIESLKVARIVMPDIPLVWISKHYIPLADLWMEGYSPHYTVLEEAPELCSSYQAQGKMISVWDPHPEERVHFHLSQGVDAVTANAPGLFIAANQE